MSAWAEECLKMEENKAIFRGENLFDCKPSEAGLENCITCFRKTNDYLRITESDGVSGDNLEAIFARHFWFTRNEYHNQTVCKSCWERIDDFHRFYCEVEKAYAPPVLAEIKIESVEDDENHYDNGGAGFETNDDVGTESMHEGLNDAPIEDDGMIYAEPLCKLVEGKNVPTKRKTKRVTKEVSYTESDSHTPLAKRKTAKTKSSNVQHTPEDQKHFKCTICPKAFASQEMLNSHLSWHQEIQQKNHHCTICDRYFFSVGFLQTHIQKQHELGDSVPVENQNDLDVSEADPGDEGTNQSRKRGTAEEIATQEELIHKFVTLCCQQCEYIAETFVDLRRHAWVDHGRREPWVNCCQKKFYKRTILYDHCLLHVNPDHFKCDLCGKTCKDSFGLQHHKWNIHTPVSERPFKCDVCGEAFVKDYLLNRHMGRHRDQEQKRHYCEQCDRVFSTAVLLKNHMHRVHGHVSEWVCDICAKQFAYRALLETHRMTHSQEGLAQMMKQCEKCGKWFNNKKNYLRHKRRTCDITEPIKCTLCEFEAITVGAFNAHKNKMHKERKMLACSYCGKEFSREIRLKEHEANHAGVMLYQCPFCPKMCNSNSNMYTHKKQAHPELWAARMAMKNAPPSERFELS